MDLIAYSETRETNFSIKGINYENPLDNRDETISLSRVYKNKTKKETIKEILLFRSINENNAYECWCDCLTMNNKKQCFLNDEKLRADDVIKTQKLFEELKI